MPEISIVIPVYRSAGGLPELHRRLTAALNELVGDDWQIVYVDDVSPDDAWQVLSQLRDDDPRVVQIQMMKNVGQQRAVLAGFEYATGRYVVTMDDDLQQRPEEIGLLYETIQSKDMDVVVGRYPQKKHGLVRNAGTRAVKTAALHTVGVPREIDLTSFRIIRQEIVQEVVKLDNPSPVVGYMLYQVTPRFANVDVHHDPRTLGGSTYGFSRLVEYFMQMILDYSDIPLRMVGYAGFFVAMASFGLGLYFLWAYLSGAVKVAGWTSLVLLLSFFSGLILMSLGIIGIYLVRILRAVSASSVRRVREERR